MAVFITDPDAFFKFARVEIPDNPKKDQAGITSLRNELSFEHVQDKEYSWQRALETYKGLNEDIRCVIYGRGGWNRWYVDYKGEIHFSARHATPKVSADIARGYGFNVWT
jgi:hypothetical protein